MDFAIHTKGPTEARVLRLALETARDEFLGDPKLEAERLETLASFRKLVDSVPPGEERDTLEKSYGKRQAEAPLGITDMALRARLAKQMTDGIAAACAMASGSVNVTISGSGRVDEDVCGRMSVQLDFVDLDGMAERLSRESPAEKVVVTGGDVVAPPV